MNKIYFCLFLSVLECLQNYATVMIVFFVFYLVFVPSKASGIHLFFPRLGIALVLYDFAICRCVFCACVGVGCVHPSYAETGCAHYICIHLIPYFEPIKFILYRKSSCLSSQKGA